MTPKRTFFAGWIRDKTDIFDVKYAARPAVLASLPETVDLTLQCPPIYDQGDLGSCTAQAIAAAYAFQHLRQGFPDPNPSKLFIYYNERKIEGTINYDSGAEIRDGIKSVVDQGIVNEIKWPYVIERFRDEPTPDCYITALLDQVVEYQRIGYDINQMRACLAEGHPFVFGINVYSNFPMQTATGKVNMPGCCAKSLGGHAMMIVGYIMESKRFIFRNSWGIGWGKKGYGTIPFNYLLDSNLGGDYWTIRLVE